MDVEREIADLKSALAAQRQALNSQQQEIEQLRTQDAVRREEAARFQQSLETFAQNQLNMAARLRDHNEAIGCVQRDLGQLQRDMPRPSKLILPDRMH